LLPEVAIQRSHIWSHGSISQKLLKQSTENLQAFYRDKGYEDVKITRWSPSMNQESMLFLKSLKATDGGLHSRNRKP
jgi:hypothetical protein